jgi:hypothetical protein
MFIVRIACPRAGGKRDDPVIIADAMIAGAQFTRRVPRRRCNDDAMPTTLPPGTPWPLLRLQDSTLRKRRW